MRFVTHSTLKTNSWVGLQDKYKNGLEAKKISETEAEVYLRGAV